MRRRLKNIYRYPIGIAFTIINYKGDGTYLSIYPFAEITFTANGLVGSTSSSPKSIDYIPDEKKTFQEPPTAEEIAKAVKKEIAPQLKSNEAIKEPPDLSTAKKEILISAINRFKIGPKSKLVDVSQTVPGYFELSASASRDNQPTFATVTTKDIFSGHYYVSVRIANLQNSRTLELASGDIWFGVNQDWSAYFIHESEAHWTGWQPLPIEKRPHLNTFSVYRKGRKVCTYVNDNLVTTFTASREQNSSSISIRAKIEPVGGRTHFQQLTVWDWEE